MTLIERIRERLDVPAVLTNYGIAARPGERTQCAVHLGSDRNAVVSPDGQRLTCHSRCGGRTYDSIDLIAAREGIPLREAIRRAAVLTGIDPDHRETAAERAERCRRQGERAAEREEIALHRRALRSALADVHRQLDEHRARLRAVGPLGPPDDVEEGILEACAYLEHELPRESPKWALTDMWARWGVENAVARALRGVTRAA
jgi:hypothetical protein